MNDNMAQDLETLAGRLHYQVSELIREKMALKAELKTAKNEALRLAGLHQAAVNEREELRAQVKETPEHLAKQAATYRMERDAARRQRDKTLDVLRRTREAVRNAVEKTV